MQVRMRQLTQRGELTAAAYKSLVQSGSGNTAAKWLTPICSNTVPTLSVSLSLSISLTPALKGRAPCKFTALHEALAFSLFSPWACASLISSSPNTEVSAHTVLSSQGEAGYVNQIKHVHVM